MRSSVSSPRRAAPTGPATLPASTRGSTAAIASAGVRLANAPGPTASALERREYRRGRHGPRETARELHPGFWNDEGPAPVSGAGPFDLPQLPLLSSNQDSSDPIPLLPLRLSPPRGVAAFVGRTVPSPSAALARAGQAAPTQSLHLPEAASGAWSRRWHRAEAPGSVRRLRGHSRAPFPTRCPVVPESLGGAAQPPQNVGFQRGTERRCRTFSAAIAAPRRGETAQKPHSAGGDVFQFARALPYGGRRRP
jgi:hypothetical protein